MYQHVRMISEGSCDTEYLSNDCKKFSVGITGINTNLEVYQSWKQIF